ncbi:MAG: hypothetical protein GX649_03540 [Chloroflexi bacterium]|nr:hypothetical protein [Chloroflexota bacterium]
MEDLERIKDRLDNIRSVEPIVTSLRTIAMGGWQVALRRMRASSAYLSNLSEVLSVLIPQVSPDDLASANVVLRAMPQRPVMLVIASERGLCGSYNDVVTEGAARLISEQQVRSERVHVATVGARATTYFQARDWPLLLSHPLPITRVPSLSLVRRLATQLLEHLASGEIDGVYVIYSPYRTTTTAEPVARLWLPIEAASLPGGESPPWPPPIVETEPRLLFRRVIEDRMLVNLFQVVMEASASEQSARYRAMDNSSSNLQELIEELTQSYHTARQHAITMEMLDLMAGSGELRRGRDRER